MKKNFMKNNENSILALDLDIFWGWDMPPEPILFCLVYVKSLATALIY